MLEGSGRSWRGLIEHLSWLAFTAWLIDRLLKAQQPTLPILPVEPEPEVVEPEVVESAEKLNGGKIHQVFKPFTPKREAWLRRTLYAAKHSLWVGFEILLAAAALTLVQWVATPEFKISNIWTDPETSYLFVAAMGSALIVHWLRSNQGSTGIEPPTVSLSPPIKGAVIAVPTEPEVVQ